MPKPQLAIILAALIATACSSGAAAPTPTATVAASAASTPTEVPITKMTVAYSSVSGDKLALFVAADGGIFTKNHLDVDPQAINGSTEAIASLLAGQATVGQFSAADALSAEAGGADLVVVGIMTPVYPYHLFVRKGINTIADLKGKKIAVTDAGGATDIATRAMLKRNGLDPDKDVDIVSVGSHANRTAALLNGAVDAGVDDVPSDKALIAAGLTPLIDLAAAKVPAADSALVFQRSYVNAHKEAVQAYVDSMVQALAYARANKDFTVGVLGKYFKITDTPLMERTYTFFLNEVMPIYPTPDPTLLGDAISVLSAKNPAIANVDLKKLLDPSYVDSARARKLAGS
ncbi:MAG TPA: ABC transporter substrate-binding protein [Candidatus Acidoferrales bacterium]|nr:ABC transporter substrate-binding protein [Candidatus Acidoferrales bacterium]